MYVLDKFQAEDFEQYSSLVFCEQVMTMNMGRVFTREEADCLFDAILRMNQSGGICGYYKVLQQSEFIGMLGLSENAEGDFEIEYMLLPEYWGKGYATRLVMEQVNRILVHCPEKRILAITDPENFGSIKVLEHNGFIKVKDFTNEDGENASLYLWQKGE